jgi:hypothetical protein
MEHLTHERLAALVDGPSTAEEATHLAGCDRCTAELNTLREQVAALGALPELMPPKGDWYVLEAKLRSEGLINNPGNFMRLGLAQTPGWMKAAAAVLLFLSGTGTGVVMTQPGMQEDTSLMADRVVSVEDAASAVRMAEQQYVSAVTEYRQLLADDGGVAVDPINRFAALEHLVRVSQAAVRQAPGDPFLNGFLASAMAERDAALRMVSSGQDNWF